MQKKLGEAFVFDKNSDTAFIRYRALNNRIMIFLKTNPDGKIYHTEQVARNGFIQTVIGGSYYEKKADFKYWGDRVYTRFISKN
jgi:hypothetical protein